MHKNILMLTAITALSAGAPAAHAQVPQIIRIARGVLSPTPTVDTATEMQHRQVFIEQQRAAQAQAIQSQATPNPITAPTLAPACVPGLPWPHR